MNRKICEQVLMISPEMICEEYETEEMKKNGGSFREVVSWTYVEP